MHPTDAITEPSAPALPPFLSKRSDQPVNGVDATHRSPILEVHHLYQNQLLGTEHFGANRTAVTIGADIGWRWSVLGVPLRFVSPSAVTALRFAPPFFSEVEATWLHDFVGPQDWFREPHTLFFSERDQWTAVVPEGWRVCLLRQGQRFSLTHLIAQKWAQQEGPHTLLELHSGDQLTLYQGQCRFVAQLVVPAHRFRATPPPDLPFTAVLSAVTGLGLLFGVLLALSPSPTTTTVLELPPRLTQAVFQLPTPPAPPQPHPSALRHTADPSGASSVSQGRSGRRDSRQAEARGNKGAMAARRAARLEVADAGVLGAIRDAGLQDGVFGRDLSAEVTAAVGGLRGPRSTRLGTGGMHDRGVGLGGHGELEGTGLHARGPISGAPCDGAQPCTAGPDLGVRRQGAIGSGAPSPLVIGHYPKTYVDEVVKRNMARIRYCYQRELTKNPDLSGKLVVKFVIAKDGSVSSATTKSSSLDSPTVDSCVNTKFQQMRFPAPPSGIVVVSYPFLFSPS